MMMTQEINPAHAASLTFGKFQSRFAGNVITDQAMLAGTPRHEQQHLLEFSQCSLAQQA